MGREYAVVREQTQQPISQTEGFRREAVNEIVPLSDGLQLWIGGQDELRAQLQQAQAANTAKETFLSSMSHDIRTPMNAIVGMTALAKKYIDEKSRVLDSLSKIEVASDHLLSLINSILDMSRIDSGRMTVSNALFSLSDLLYEVLTIVRPQAEKKRHRLRLQLGDIFAEGLYGDSLRLRQIFVNVISNAVKYTNEGGTIVLHVSVEQEQERAVLVFRCEDNGVGMTQEFLEQIFLPFTRAGSAAASGAEGTGLGMSIVKKLLDAMSGFIHVESKVGAGTNVTIRVPMHYERLQVNTEALNGKHLLLLEADNAIEPLLRSYLGEYGIRCTLVRTSSEGISALTDAEFRGERFNGVVFGRSVSKTDTVFETAAYVSKYDSELPIVMVSDRNWDEIEYQANRCGIHHFIPVPFFRKSLINGLNAALQSASAGGSSSSTPDLSGKHILLVEDNFINREIACELLLGTQAQVDLAKDGQQAVDAFLRQKDYRYDLILMDIQMPVMNGYEAVERIRASGAPDAASVQIYAMTANTFAEDIARAKDAGMDGHIAKPVDVNRLMQILRQLNG